MTVVLEAAVFGNELTAFQATRGAACDEKVHMPMFGFMESFNISVSARPSASAPLCLTCAALLDCGLTPEEKDSETGMAPENSPAVGNHGTRVFTNKCVNCRA